MVVDMSGAASGLIATAAGPLRLLHVSRGKIRSPATNAGETVTTKTPAPFTLPVPMGTSFPLPGHGPKPAQWKIVMQLLPGVALGIASPLTIVEPVPTPLVITGAMGVRVGVTLAVGVIVRVVVGVLVAVTVGVSVGVLVSVIVGVTLAVGVIVGVNVSVGVGVIVGVSVCVGVSVGVPVNVGVKVSVGVFVGVRVAVTVVVLVAVGVLVGVLVTVAVFEGVAVAVLVRVTVWVGVSVDVGVGVGVQAGPWALTVAGGGVVHTMAPSLILHPDVQVPAAPIVRALDPTTPCAARVIVRRSPGLDGDIAHAAVAHSVPGFTLLSALKIIRQPDKAVAATTFVTWMTEESYVSPKAYERAPLSESAVVMATLVVPPQAATEAGFGVMLKVTAAAAEARAPIRAAPTTSPVIARPHVRPELHITQPLSAPRLT